MEMIISSGQILKARQGKTIEYFKTENIKFIPRQANPLNSVSGKIFEAGSSQRCTREVGKQYEFTVSDSEFIQS